MKKPDGIPVQLSKSFSTPDDLAQKLYSLVDQTPERRSGVPVLTDWSNGLKGLFELVFWFPGFLAAGVSIIGFFRHLWSLTVNDPFDVLRLAFMGVVGCFGVLLTALGLLGILAIPFGSFKIARVGNGKLIFKSFPLHLGETMAVIFQRHLRLGMKTKNPGVVLGRLVCLEICRDNRGSGSYQFYGDVVCQYAMPQHVVVPGTACIEQEWSINIPAEAPPTMRDKKLYFQDYFVLWAIEIKLVVPGLVNESSLFFFDVKPEVLCTNT
jgi:hypothetical protein